MLKSITHSIFTMIGLRFLAIFMLVFAFACGNKFKLPDVYSTQIHNNTGSRIAIRFKERIYGYNSDDTLKINVNDYIVAIEHFPVILKRISSDDDPYPIKKFFDGFTIVEISVYRNDSLKVVWSEPAIDLPVTSHSFFNYNSWEVIPTPDVLDQTGTINFYIEEADLE